MTIKLAGVWRAAIDDLACGIALDDCGDHMLETAGAQLFNHAIEVRFRLVDQRLPEYRGALGNDPIREDISVGWQGVNAQQLHFQVHGFAQRHDMRQNFFRER